MSYQPGDHFLDVVAGSNGFDQSAVALAIRLWAEHPFELFTRNFSLATAAGDESLVLVARTCVELAPPELRDDFHRIAVATTERLRVANVAARRKAFFDAWATMEANGPELGFEVVVSDANGVRVERER